MLAASCSKDAAESRANPATTTIVGSTDTDNQPPGSGKCDDTDAAACLLPWPSDAYTRNDSTTQTLRRVDIPSDATPANVAGGHIDPKEWNRNDGFSPSSIGLTVVPGIDLVASKLPPQTDIARSLAADSNLVVVDTSDSQRVAAWAELDPGVEDPQQALLRIVPAVALPEGHRFAIALRGLKRADGTAIGRSAGFAKLMAHPTSTQRGWLQAVESAIPAPQLDLAWAFTIGSGDDLSGRLRHMWTETSTELGNGAPAFSIESADVAGPARIIRGSFEMPNYLQGDGGPGSVMNNDGDPMGIPTRNGTMSDAFICVMPAGASGDAPVPVVLYGHGLLGSRAEVLDIGVTGAAAGVGFCAVDFLGMSTADVPSVLSQFSDLAQFRATADRLQEGQLGVLLLGRLLASSKGFATDAAFRDDVGRSVIDPARLSLLGASQGGILGGVASSLTNDWNRVILAVGGLGYNLLLGRSVDFDEFLVPFVKNYPSALDRALALELIEQLWQRGENTGYAQHLTKDPYDTRSGPSTVLQLEAFGDHQVANVATEKLARTLGIGRRAPTLAAGRSTDVQPFFGIDPIQSLPSSGSGLVVWDFDTPAPPASDTPNRAGDDPHGKLGDVPQALAMVLAFIQPDGKITDVCGGEPCHTPG